MLPSEAPKMQKMAARRSPAAPKPATGTSDPWDRVRPWLAPTALILLAFVAHGSTIRAGFVWDDDAYVTQNSNLRDGSGLHHIWFQLGARMYVPLVYTTLWFGHALWGLSPAGYHAVNVALHAVCSLLFYILLRRLGVAGAWLAAAIFAVHPVFVETVAWISELKNLQSAALALLCLLASVWSLPAAGDPPARAPARGRSLLAFLLFVAALLSKPSVVFLPVVVLLLIWWKLGRRPSMADVVPVAPMFVASACVGLLTMYLDYRYLGGNDPQAQLPLLERPLVAGRALWFYVAKLVWPATLTSIYPRWEISATAWWQWLYPLAAVLSVAALWALRRRIGRGPLVAVLSFMLLLAPVLGLVGFSYNVYSFVADHFQYHAAPALIALFAAGVTRACRTRVQKGLLLAASAILLAALSIASGAHARVFANEKARCLDTLEKNPSAWVAMNNLGVALNREGRHGEAVQWLEQAIRVRPAYPEAHSNLGVALVASGEPQRAIEHYREALRMWPDYAQAHNNLGAALAAVGDLDGALREYREAIRLAPNHAEAQNNLAKLLAMTGDVSGAIREGRQAVALRPDSADAHRDLGVTLASAGRLDEALHEFREALRINPNDAKTRNGLGVVLASLNRKPEAIEQFREALAVDPRSSEAHNNLGNALAEAGDLPGAIGHYREAIRLKANNAEARLNLGKALLSRGDLLEAAEQLQQGLAVDPNSADGHNLLGVALARSGKMESAIVHFESAVRLDPTSASARENLARARGRR